MSNIWNISDRNSRQALALVPCLNRCVKRYFLTKILVRTVTTASTKHSSHYSLQSTTSNLRNTKHEWIDNHFSLNRQGTALTPILPIMFLPYLLSQFRQLHIALFTSVEMENITSSFINSWGRYRKGFRRNIEAENNIYTCTASSVRFPRDLDICE